MFYVEHLQNDQNKRLRDKKTKGRKSKTPEEGINRLQGFFKKNLGSDLPSHGKATLLSALSCFTTEFGMVSGGSNSLKLPRNSRTNKILALHYIINAYF